MPSPLASVSRNSLPSRSGAVRTGAWQRESLSASNACCSSEPHLKQTLLLVRWLMKRRQYQASPKKDHSLEWLQGTDHSYTVVTFPSIAGTPAPLTWWPRNMFSCRSSLLFLVTFLGVASTLLPLSWRWLRVEISRECQNLGHEQVCRPSRPAGSGRVHQLAPSP